MAETIARDLTQVRRELADLSSTMPGWLAQCDALVKARPSVHE
jgi:hypothetical protein